MANQKKPDRPKSASGQHKKERKGINLPAEWHALAEQLAAMKPSPVLWYLLRLIRADARKKGVPENQIPKVPWKMPFGGVDGDD